MGQIFEFIGNHPFLFAALVAFLTMLVMNEFKRKLLGYKEVSPNDAVRLINQEDAIVLDVREDSEYQEGHIINAIHIPLGLLDGRVDELGKDREKALMVYCRSGTRAAKAASLLQKQGFKSVYKMKGGMMSWIDAGLPANRGKKNKKSS